MAGLEHVPSDGRRRWPEGDQGWLQTPVWLQVQLLGKMHQCPETYTDVLVHAAPVQHKCSTGEMWTIFTHSSRNTRTLSKV